MREKKERLIIIGAGGHGKVVADVALKMKSYKEIFFLDDYKSGEVIGIPIIGKFSEYESWSDGSEYFAAIGDSRIRESVITRIESFDAQLASLVHPNAVIGKNVSIGEGSVIMAGTVINPDSRIGKGVILNTACSIDHDNVVGDYCHISVGAHLAGGVEIGVHTMIGAGATIINNVSICPNCMIGAGATVIKNIEESGTYIGIPAQKQI